MEQQLQVVFAPADGAVEDGWTWLVLEWPKPALDRLAMRTIWQAIADAVGHAELGHVESEPLTWLWDVGRDWADLHGGKDFQKQISNLCEEIEIMAYAYAKGERYEMPRPLWLALCKWWRRR